MALTLYSRVNRVDGAPVRFLQAKHPQELKAIAQDNAGVFPFRNDVDPLSLVADRLRVKPARGESKEALVVLRLSYVISRNGIRVRDMYENVRASGLPNLFEGRGIFPTIGRRKPAWQSLADQLFQAIAGVAGVPEQTFIKLDVPAIVTDERREPGDIAAIIAAESTTSSTDPGKIAVQAFGLLAHVCNAGGCFREKQFVALAPMVLAELKHRLIDEALSAATLVAYSSLIAY